LWPRKVRYYLALNETSLYGVKTFDICCFRGVSALALTTPEKTLGFAINICGIWFVSDLIALYWGGRDFGTLAHAEIYMAILAARGRLGAFKMLETGNSIPED
jgi:hypothetical protein